MSQNVSQVKNHLLRAYCEPGRGEALGVDRAARGRRGTRLIKGPDQQRDHVLGRQGDVRSGSHQGLACWRRVWWVGRISERLSNEAKCRSGFKNDHQSCLSWHQEVICDLYSFTSHPEIGTV